MADGFFLGGVASGLDRSIGRQLQSRQLDIQQQAVEGNNEARRQRLTLEKQQIHRGIAKSALEGIANLAQSFQLDPGIVKMRETGEPSLSGVMQALQKRPAALKLFNTLRSQFQNNALQANLDPQLAEAAFMNAVTAQTPLQQKVAEVEGAGVQVSPEDRRQLAGLTADTKVQRVEAVARLLGKNPQDLDPQLRETILGLGSNGPFQGKGFKADTANLLHGLAAKIAQVGFDGLSEDEQRAYTFAYNEITTPTRVSRPDGSIAFEQRTLDSRFFPAPSDAPSGSGGGKTLTDVPDSAKRTPERAGRTAMIEEASGAVDDVISSLIVPDPADPDTDTIDEANMAAFILNVGDGRDIRAKFLDAISAKLRLETGAQANDQEIENIAKRFMPSIFDNDKTQISKLKRLRQFFERSLELTDPELFKRLQDRAGG